MFNWLQKLLRPKKPRVNKRGEVLTTKDKKAIDTSSDIHQLFDDSSILRSTKDPIIVRGKHWVNTSEERWELAQKPKILKTSDVEELIKGLDQVHCAEVRCSAAESLGRLGLAATLAIPTLIKSSIDNSKQVRNAALEALNKIDPDWPNKSDVYQAIPYLIAALKNRSSEVINAAISLLTKIGSPAVPYFTDVLLDGEDTLDKVYILRIFSWIDSNVETAVPGIIKMLDSQHLLVRIAAANTLAKIGPTEDAIPVLMMGLSDPFANGREAMAICLGQAGVIAEPAIPSLIPLLADRDTDVRKAVAETVGKIGLEALPALIEIVKTRDAHRLKAWAEAKTKILQWFEEPPYDMMINDPYKTYWNLSWTAYDILEKQECLEIAQEAALQILGNLGSEAASAVPIIIESLKDRNPRIRSAAVQALGQIGPDVSEVENVVSGLIYALVDDNKSVRDASTRAIKNFDCNRISGSMAAEAIERISGNLETPGDLSVLAFTSIGIASVPRLIHVLETGNRVARENAARAIGQIRPEAEYIIPILKKALQDNHPWVQAEVAKAIGKIESDTA